MMLSTAGLSAALALVTTVQIPVQYDLRVGDHVVYRQVMDETVDNRRPYGFATAVDRPLPQQRLREVHAEWEVHLMVLGAHDDELIIGVQRNRVDLSLERYTLAGEDVLAERGPALLERLGAQRSAHYAHAMRLSRTGDEQLPGQILREWNSKALWALSELPPLPGALAQRASFWTNDLLNMSYVAREWETIDPGTCMRSEGLAAASLLLDRSDVLPDSVVHRIWYCPNLGLVGRIEFEGSYPGAVFQEIHQRFTWEFVERRRDESAAVWLVNDATQEGAVAGLTLLDQIPFSLGQIYGLLGQGSQEMDLRLLGLAYRSGWQVPPPAMLQRLVQSGNPRLMALATRMGAAEQEAPEESPDAPPDAPDPAADDEDPGAAASQEPDPSTAGAPEPIEAPVCAPPALRNNGWELPGTALRVLSGTDFNGWPYGVRVPEDYRGDEPFPLVFYLAGNGGPMLEGITIASPEMANTGYIVVYPQAVGAWEDPRTATMFDQLYREVMKRFNVDPDRVYITGLSNGGTGTYRFATMWPHRFTAAVSAMGAGQLGPQFPGLQYPEPTHLRNLAMLFLHGERDQTISPAATRATLELLVPREAPLESHFFAERGHGITPGAGDDGLTVEFFERFRTRANPRTVRLSGGVLDYPRQYWVEVIVKEEGEDRIATVDAELGDDGAITIQTANVRRLRLLLSPRLLGSLPDIRVEINGRSVFDGPVAHDCALLQETFTESGDPYSAYSQVLEFDVGS